MGYYIQYCIQKDTTKLANSLSLNGQIISVTRKFELLLSEFSNFKAVSIRLRGSRNKLKSSPLEKGAVLI